tara:strand:+ start:699 stop:1808 length:1110 start_codon:yes stop_codon:yes gene_type:complete
MEDFRWLENEMITTPDAKTLLCVYPFKNVVDKNAEWWDVTGKPFDIESIRNNAIDFFNNKYYNAKRLNEIIPITKHKEWCDKVAIEMMKKPEFTDKIWNYSKEVTHAFLSIEKNGICVTDDVCDIFDERVRKHISEGKLYTRYNLWTSTGRPSNSFGSVNFAALTKEQRKAFIPENDMLVEYDYDAYHLRLIGDFIGYKFPQASVHEYLASFYGSTYEESKQITFKLLYGGIDETIRKQIPFFDKTQKFIDEKWEEFNDKNYVETDIYIRKLYKNNYTSMNRNKLFNYIIQAYETEVNIKTIIELQDYLKNKRTKLVLYGYDSFTFDFNTTDGVNVLKDVKKILEKDRYLIKAKAGKNFGEMNSITERL